MLWRRFDDNLIEMWYFDYSDAENSVFYVLYKIVLSDVFCFRSLRILVTYVGSTVNAKRCCNDDDDVSIANRIDEISLFSVGIRLPCKIHLD